MLNLDHYRVLLQLSLGQDVTSICSIIIDDWAEIFEFAQRQGIVGFLFEGVKRLHDEFGYDVPQPILFQWISIVEIIKQRNFIATQRTIEIYNLFREAGFKGCILKGQGNARLYNNPISRIPGDIDYG